MNELSQARPRFGRRGRRADASGPPDFMYLICCICVGLSCAAPICRAHTIGRRTAHRARWPAEDKQTSCGGRPYDLKRACELDINEQARGRTVYFILRGARQTGLKRPAGTGILLRLWAGLRTMESLMGCTRDAARMARSYTSQV